MIGLLPHLTPLRGLCSNYKDVVMRDSPVGYWRLDEITGTVAIDEIGNSNGVYTNQSNLRQGYNALIAGGGNRSCDFIPNIAVPASTGYVKITNTSAFAWTNTITVEAWISPNATASSQHIVCQGGAAIGFQLIWNGDTNTFSFQVRAAFPTTTLTSFPVEKSTMYHVVGQWSTALGQMLITVNGRIVALAGATTSGLNPGGFIEIGARLVQGTQLGTFSGTIDEVAYYTTYLTPDRIAAHYRSGIGQMTPTRSNMSRFFLAD